MTDCSPARLGGTATRSVVLVKRGRVRPAWIGRHSDLTSGRRPTEVHDVCSRPRTAEAVSYLASQGSRARGRTEARAPAPDPLPPRRRPRRTGAAGGAIPALRPRPRAALQLRGRAVRRSVPSGEPRLAQGNRPLRSRSRL